MGETPNSVLAPFRLSAARPYSHELVLRPLTRAELAADGVPDAGAPAPCPPDVTLTTDGRIEPGTAEPVQVQVSPRCAAGLRDATVRLTAPDGWTVQPASADLGTLAGPETAAFTVTAPAGTDLGTYRLTATAVTATPDGFRSTTTATATTDAPLPPGYQWLSDRPFTAPANGWGPVEKDRSNGEQGAADGNPLTIGDVVYPKGLGTHAVSAVQTELGGDCTRLRADVGVDDETGNAGSVVFEVWGDGTRLAQTGVLTGADAARRLDVDVTGVQRLELRVTDAGNGNGNDHADWAAARLACG
jgi:beta-galactosidase